MFFYPARYFHLFARSSRSAYAFQPCIKLKTPYSVKGYTMIAFRPFLSPTVACNCFVLFRAFLYMYFFFFRRMRHRLTYSYSSRLQAACRLMTNPIPPVHRRRSLAVIRYVCVVTDVRQQIRLLACLPVFHPMPTFTTIDAHSLAPIPTLKPGECYI